MSTNERHAQAPSSTMLLSLPPEIIREICKLLCTHCTDYHGLRDIQWNPKSLANLCQTSKALRQIASPFIYHVFPVDLLNIGKRLVPLLEAMRGNPAIAECIQCIVAEKHYSSGQLSWEQSEMTARVLSIRKNDIEFYNSHPASSRLHMVLCRAKNLHTLRVVEDHCSMPPFRFADLTALRPRKGNPDFEALCTPLPGTGISAWSAPSLRRLELVSCSVRPDMCESVLRAAPNVEQLYISPSFTKIYAVEASIKILAAGLKKLSSLELYFYESIGIKTPTELLVLLVSRKRNLKTLFVASRKLYVDFEHLSEFTALTSLTICCPFFKDPQVPGARIRVSKLPLSLEALFIGSITRSLEDLEEVAVELSQRVSELENLKEFQLTRQLHSNNHQCLFNMSNPSTAERNRAADARFKKAGVQTKVLDYRLIPVID